MPMKCNSVKYTEKDFGLLECSINVVVYSICLTLFGIFPAILSIQFRCVLSVFHHVESKDCLSILIQTMLRHCF